MRLIYLGVGKNIIVAVYLRNVFVTKFSFVENVLKIGIGALRPSQQQWSCRDVASILWDFYSTSRCHDTQNVLHKYNHPTESIRLIIDGLTKPHFLGRL